jgi:hypothetical protein
MPRNDKYFEIQKRLASALSYFRILKRLSRNEITEITGLNFYLILSGVRPVSLFTMVKMESVFGTEIASNLFKNAWPSEGEWTVKSLAIRCHNEQVKWNKEKIARHRA